MNRIRLVTAAFCGILVYVVLSVLCGQNGVWAEKQLAEQQAHLQSNVASVSRLNEELKLRYDLLRYDADIIAAYARKIGFVYSGEKIIKISGLPVQNDAAYDIGTPYLKMPVLFMPEWMCKSFGLVIFVLSYFIVMLNQLKKETAVHHRAVPVQYAEEAGV